MGKPCDIIKQYNSFLFHSLYQPVIVSFLRKNFCFQPTVIGIPPWQSDSWMLVGGRLFYIVTSLHGCSRFDPLESGAAHKQLLVSRNTWLYCSLSNQLIAVRSPSFSWVQQWNSQLITGPYLKGINTFNDFVYFLPSKHITVDTFNTCIVNTVLWNINNPLFRIFRSS